MIIFERSNQNLRVSMQHATHDFMENVTTLLGSELNFRLRAKKIYERT